MRKLLLTSLIMLMSTFSVQAAEQTTRLVTLYRIAPGKHVEFMKYLAAKEQAERDAGIPNTQIFVHEDGAGWDFLMVDSGTTATPAQLEAYKKAVERHRIPTGAKAWVDLREFIADHEDMIVSGPTTATDWLKQLEKK